MPSVLSLAPKYIRFDIVVYEYPDESPRAMLKLPVVLDFRA